MIDKLPQSEIAKNILSELKKLSFDEIMALPVSEEARDINNALLEMSKCILDFDTQVGVFRIFKIRKNIYIQDNVNSLTPILLINSDISTSYEVTSCQLTQLAA